MKIFPPELLLRQPEGPAEGPADPPGAVAALQRAEAASVQKLPVRPGNIRPISKHSELKGNEMIVK